MARQTRDHDYDDESLSDILGFQVRNDVIKFLNEHTDLSQNEVLNYFAGSMPISFPGDAILAIVLFGSTQKHLTYKKGWFLKSEYKKKCNDMDIGIIIDDGIIDIRKNTFRTDHDVVVRTGEYTEECVGKVKRDYLILTKKMFLNGLKKKTDFCLALKNGKKLYVKDIETRKELFGAT